MIAGPAVPAGLGAPAGAHAHADRVGPVSFVSSHPGRAELLARVRELAGGGEVSIAYRTRATVTRAGA